MFHLFTLFITLIIVFIIYKIIQWRKYSHIPGAFGHCFPFSPTTFTMTHPKKGVEFMKNTGKTFGPIFHNNVGGSNWVVISDLETCKDIIKERDIFPNDTIFRKSLTKLMGQSMFASEGQIWKEKHEILLPLLNQRMMQHSGNIVGNKALQLIDAINRDIETAKKNGKDVIEIVSLMKRFTLDVIGEMAFGVDFCALSTEQRKFDGLTFSDLATSQLDAINKRFMVPKSLWELPLPVFNKEKRGCQVLKAMFGGLIEQTESQLESGEEPNNLLSLIIKARKADNHVANKIYPKDQMLGECFSVWGAGHDTTTYTCAHVLKLLSMHQDIQQKARDEILYLDKKLNGKMPSYSDMLKETPYLGAVIKEAQRLYPIAPFLLRESMKDKTYLGYPIPKGSTMIINVYNIHHDDKYFHDSNDYIPERWFEDGHTNLPFIAFGLGPRSCFGRKLALLEVKMMLYVLLKNYILVDNSDKYPHKCELNFGLVPEKKILHLTLEPIENK